MTNHKKARYSTPDIKSYASFWRNISAWWKSGTGVYMRHMSHNVYAATVKSLLHEHIERLGK